MQVHYIYDNSPELGFSAVWKGFQSLFLCDIPIAMASPSPFLITEHVIDSQHVREYPRATRTGDDALKLMVKQYTPKSNPHPQPGDLTIIGAHGSGFPKVSGLDHRFDSGTVKPVQVVQINC